MLLANFVMSGKHELISRPLDQRSAAPVCVLIVLEVLMAFVQSI